MEGYIKLHRQIVDSWVFTDPVSLKIWVWLLAKSSIKNQVISLKIGKGSTNVHIERGQLIFGRNAAAEYLDIPARTIERHLVKFQNDGMILKKATNQYSIITICKYDVYQSEKSSQRPTNGVTNDQPMDLPTTTYKNDKKEKNIDREILSGIIEAVIEYLNDRCNKTFNTKSKDSIRVISARLKDGYKVVDFFSVIDIKASQWMNDMKMNQYLRPATLFSEKFESYLVESQAKIVAIPTEPKKPHHFLSVAN